MKKFIVALTFLCAICLILYGSVRVYFYWTDGFSLGNIERKISFEEAWTIRLPTLEEKTLFSTLIKQRFNYLGKGCQSYVFLSEDDKFVLKFIKHHRFMVKPWVEFFAHIFPFVQEHMLSRMDHKKEKLGKLLEGWRVAYNDLPAQTGLVWINLNENSKNDFISFEITDKMGFPHRINLQNYQFIIQRKAEMLCPYLENLINTNNEKEAKILIDRILLMVENFYMAGFADYDHALMQNTGVIEGIPVPIDVGQFIKDPSAKEIAHFKQALFNKTYRFRIWLGEHSQELKEYLEQKLKTIIGEEFIYYKPHFDV